MKQILFGEPIIFTAYGSKRLLLGRMGKTINIGR
jgi:hypothetical protein